MQKKERLHLSSDRLNHFNPADLLKKDVIEEIKNNPYHIYVVSVRKKYFILETITDHRDYNETTFYSLDDNNDKCPHSIKHDKSVWVDSVSGNRVILTDGINSVDYSHTLAINILFLTFPNASSSQPFLSDFKVVYIGQAQGIKKPRKINSRIEKHEKILKIALDILSQNTNLEIMITGVCVTKLEMDFSNLFGGSGIKIFNENDPKIAPTKSEITLYEAGLINYFQPIHNKKFKEKLVLDSIKDEYENLLVEFATHKATKSRHFSDVAKPTYNHLKLFPTI